MCLELEMSFSLIRGKIFVCSLQTMESIQYVYGVCVCVYIYIYIYIYIYVLDILANLVILSCSRVPCFQVPCFRVWFIYLCSLSLFYYFLTLQFTI